MGLSHDHRSDSAPVATQPAICARELKPRELWRALAGDVSEDTLRHRSGWLPSFRRQHEEENVLRTERELAEGHASYCFSGYVTVGAASAEELEATCAEVEQAASRSHLELERLVAQQETAFTYTLPLCEVCGYTLLGQFEMSPAVYLGLTAPSRRTRPYPYPSEAPSRVSSSVAGPGCDTPATVLYTLLYNLLGILIQLLIIRGRSEAVLRAEVLALRHQLAVLER